MKKSILSLFLCLSFSVQAQTRLTVDCSKPIGEMNPIWAWFGYDEPNYTYMKDGKKLLTELAELSPVPVYVRAHNLMCTGDGTVALKWGSTNMYREDDTGNPIYTWNIVDSIFDTYVERGIKPLAQLGFTPEALSSKPQPYQHSWKPGVEYGKIYTGWSYPPNDMKKWEELVYQWVSHCVERYGEKEVSSWYWELWNEPDSPYFQGTVEDYNKLYDYSVSGIHRALSSAKVGGPHVTGPGGKRGATFLRKFLEHCVSGTNYVTGKIGTPIDFIAFHAKGSPKVIDKHVRMSMSNQLRDIDKGCEIVASYPTLKHLPIIIGESDPEGCAACGMHTNPENAYRNGTMYSSYTAASFARKYEIADKWGVNLMGAVSWSFEFEDQPWFYGFRDLATNGVDKPVLNVFRMFGMMDGKRLEVGGDGLYSADTIIRKGVRGLSDINAMASLSDNKLAVMVWNYNDDDIYLAPQSVELRLSNLPFNRAQFNHYRIDAEHSNSYEAWKLMGSPQQPTASQIKELEQAGKLDKLQKSRKVSSSKTAEIDVDFTIASQGVSLLVYNW